VKKLYSFSLEDFCNAIEFVADDLGHAQIIAGAILEARALLDGLSLKQCTRDLYVNESDVEFQPTFIAIETRWMPAASIRYEPGPPSTITWKVV
jgi:hypothetical protein